MSPVKRAVTLLNIRPGGVAVRVGRRSRLSITSAHSRSAGAVRVSWRTAVVRVLLDRGRGRVSLFVGGAKAGSVPAALSASTRVYVGTTGGRPAAPFTAGGPTSASARATTTRSAPGGLTSVFAPGTPTAASPTAVSPTPASPTTAASPIAASPIAAAPIALPAQPTSATSQTSSATTSTAATATTTATTTITTATAPAQATSGASTTSVFTPATAATASSGTAWPSVNPFSPTSFWNAPLASTASLDPNSTTYVNDLVSQIKQYGAWMNTTWYSVPTYVVPAGQTTASVTLDTWGPDLQQAFNAVPIPSGAVAANGSDESLSVYQPSTGKEWDFWLMHQVNGVWHARWGGEMDNVSTSPGYYTHSGQTNNWGATATGLPLIGGLITLADLQRGYINHALAIAVPLTEKGVFSWPAQRGDGWSTSSTALPEGIRFRLDPSVNVANLGLPWLDRLIAQAAQTYGIVVRDTSGAVSLYAQDPTPTGANPWSAPFDGWSEGTYLSWLPWSRMEALHTQLSG